MRLLESFALFFLAPFTLVLACASDGEEVDTSTTGDGRLGAPCTRGLDCRSGRCLEESEPLFGTGGPPGGICTDTCENDELCPDGSVCTETKSGLRCLPGCDFGEDSTKCGGRDELACEPILWGGETSCEDDDQCADGELCFVSEEGGVCRSLLGLCTPRCGSDADCTDGRFCHPGTGECVHDEPNGLALGAPCDPNADTCRGLCVDLGDGTGECEERCRVGAPSGCGEAEIEKSELVCGFFAFDLSDAGVRQGNGDTGACARLCDCNDECPFDQLCLNNVVGDYAGICAGGIAVEDSVPCADPGSGGGGGAGGGGS